MHCKRFLAGTGCEALEAKTLVCRCSQPIGISRCLSRCPHIEVIDCFHPIGYAEILELVLLHRVVEKGMIICGLSGVAPVSGGLLSQAKARGRAVPSLFSSRAQNLGASARWMRAIQKVWCEEDCRPGTQCSLHVPVVSRVE